MTSTSNIVDLLYMPEAADIDIDFEKIEFPILQNAEHEDFVRGQIQTQEPAPK